jgi:hypothetical protein
LPEIELGRVVEEGLASLSGIKSSLGEVCGGLALPEAGAEGLAVLEELGIEVETLGGGVAL